MTEAAGLASPGRSESVIAGFVVAAIMGTLLAGAMLIWQRRNTAYQCLHDMEMAAME